MKDLVDAVYNNKKISKKKLLTWVGLSESSYYYKETGGRKGNLPSLFTYHKDLGLVDEDAVIESIKCILSEPFIDCGHRIMTAYLHEDGYQINHKKVYRIMKRAKLLQKRIFRDHSRKKFVNFRKVNTERPLECLEMDIKMVWIPNKGKNAYLLSIIDVHTRRILKDYFSFNIKQQQVIDLLSDVFQDCQYPDNVVIRTDNGSQFIAHSVREYLTMIDVSQEFTHVATPEESAHIEAYHGTLRREVFTKYEYHTFGQIEQILKKYVVFYNERRLHGLLGRITPMQKWNQDKHLVLNKQKAA